MFTTLLHKLIGDHDTDLRHRLLSAFCFMIAACFLLFTAFDMLSYVATNPTYWLLDCLFAIISFYLYYLAFYKKRFSLSLYLTLALTYSAILSSWYNMGGMNMMIGVGFIVFICYFTFLLADKWYILFILSNGIFIMLLASVQLSYPDFVVKQPSLEDAIIQQSICIFAICIVLFIGIYIIKSSRDYEQTAAETHRLKLEKLNKVQSQMISIISHDVRSPMLNVQLMLNMMENGLLPKEKIPEMAKQIGYNMTNSRELLESMVSWTRSQVREINQNKTGVQTLHTSIAHNIIEKNRLEWTNNAKRKQINIAYSPNCALETTIAADDNLLQTALRNIVLNAIKFTPTGGSVTIESHLENDELRIDVTDTGMGMSPERSAQLFQTKLNASKGTTGERGSGIGLWIVSDMLERTDARISVASEEGKGSTFTLNFPLYKEN
jgi:two-component system, sensor histidine kinase and response regulator